MARPQLGGVGAQIFGLPGRRQFPVSPYGGGDDDSIRGRQSDPPDVPALQRDRRPLRGEGAEFAEQVALVPFLKARSGSGWRPRGWRRNASAARLR